MNNENKWTVWINAAAQGVVTPVCLLREWDTLTLAEQRLVNRLLMNLLLQAKFTLADVVTACKYPGLKVTYTPCVLLLKTPKIHTARRLLNLPDNEMRRVFLLLFAVFSCAYERNRSQNTSPHKWWLHDFQHPNVVVQIGQTLMLPVGRIQEWLDVGREI